MTNLLFFSNNQNRSFKSNGSPSITNLNGGYRESPATCASSTANRASPMMKKDPITTTISSRLWTWLVLGTISGCNPLFFNSANATAAAFNTALVVRFTFPSAITSRSQPVLEFIDVKSSVAGSNKLGSMFIPSEICSNGAALFTISATTNKIFEEWWTLDNNNAEWGMRNGSWQIIKPWTLALDRMNHRSPCWHQSNHQTNLLIFGHAKNNSKWIPARSNMSHMRLHQQNVNRSHFIQISSKHQSWSNTQFQRTLNEEPTLDICVSALWTWRTLHWNCVLHQTQLGLGLAH